MTYNDLDINQRINFKDALRAWAQYSIQHFGEQLDKKVYRVRTSRRARARTGELKRTWYQQVNVGNGIDRVMIQFLQYGRYVDMGVGRGVSHTDRLVARQLREGPTSRRRKPWYSKRKTYEIKRLREILAQQNINIALDAVENIFRGTVSVTL